MRIAIAGNPNSGKTTLFNELTGKVEYVGNWPGVTVEKKEALIKQKYNPIKEDIKLVDLPGAYSISPYTGEEVITRDYVVDSKPEAIINIVDAANLSRSLFFTTQLLELGIPVIIALNKVDIMQRRKEEIDLDAFSKLLSCPIIETVATSGEGLAELIKETVERSKAGGQVAISIEGDTDLARQKKVDELAAGIYKVKSDTSKSNFSDKLDMIFANKILGLPIFFLVLYVIYFLSIEGIGGYFSGMLNDDVFGAMVPDAANAFFESIGLHPLFQAFLVDGLIGGVGAVLGFLPLIMVLFFLLALLEDSGYMARIAVIMDIYFKRIGLSGKSIIPMIVGSGCAIPGVMATRTIEDINERRMTTILTPFVPCGAKAPIIALFAAAFFGGNSIIGPSMYLIAIGVIIISGILLKKIFRWETGSTFILELPEYKIPSIKHALISMFDKAWAFVRKATTIIVICNAFVWFTSTYGPDFQPVAEQSESILAILGGYIAPLLIPLGFLGWQLAAATVTGFIAKENVVATLAVIFLGAASAEAAADAENVEGALTAATAFTSYFTPVTAFSYMVFNLFTPPCFAAIGAMNSELASRKWLLKTLAFQIGVGYTLAMLVTQIGTPLLYGKLAPGFVPSMLILAGIIVLLIYLINRNKTPKLAEQKN